MSTINARHLLFCSRAHTIVAINFSQKFLGEAGDSMTRSSTINLVDLAGRYWLRSCHRLANVKVLHRFMLQLQVRYMYVPKQTSLRYINMTSNNQLGNCIKHILHRRPATSLPIHVSMNSLCDSCNHF